MPRTPIRTDHRKHRRRSQTQNQRGGRSRITRRIQKGGLCLIAALLSSCSTAHFYSQAVGGQLELTLKAEPAARVIADPETPDLLRTKLEVIADIRRFAKEELKLKTGRSYTKYVDLERESVVWSVFAAPKFSLRPKTWKYPIIGALSYRGYFSEADADEEAAQLKALGYDTYIGKVGAYSTLGFFADPILNTFIERSDTSVAELIFHELAHRRLYKRGQTAFNESFANAVAQEGVRRWLRSSGNREDVGKYEKLLKRRAELLEAIANTHSQLEGLYASDQSEAITEQEKRQIFRALQSRIRSLFKKWGAEAPENYVAQFDNNARMTATSTYHDLVPFFEKLFKESGSDFERFYEAAETATP